MWEVFSSSNPTNSSPARPISTRRKPDCKAFPPTLSRKDRFLTWLPRSVRMVINRRFNFILLKYTMKSSVLKSVMLSYTFLPFHFYFISIISTIKGSSYGASSDQPGRQVVRVKSRREEDSPSPEDTTPVHARP